jgi:hypothetical protein
LYVPYTTSVTDPYHFGADADPDPACPFDADPDPTFHFDADPDPSFYPKAQNLEKVLKYASIPNIFAFHPQIYADPDTDFTLRRIRIHLYPAFQFDVVPDPQRCIPIYPHLLCTY